MRPWRPPFHASPVVSKGPISSKRVSSQDPLLRKFWNFSLYSLHFHPNFSSQAPKFGNFQLTSNQIWKFSVHKPPNLEIFSSQAPLFWGKYQLASPTLWKSGPHTPTWKKVKSPRGSFSWATGQILVLIVLILMYFSCWIQFMWSWIRRDKIVHKTMITGGIFRFVLNWK